MRRQLVSTGSQIISKRYQKYVHVSALLLSKSASSLPLPHALPAAQQRTYAKGSSSSSSSQTSTTTTTMTNDNDEKKKNKMEETKFEKLVNEILNHNRKGEVHEAVQRYEQLKRNHLFEMQLRDYNKILVSFAPRNILFKWYQPYKDFVDMYFETGKFRPDERMDEAMAVFKDISASPLNLQPDTVSYNSLMKVQLSAGPRNVINVFRSFNEMQHQSITNQALQPNVATFINLLRACAMLERADLAEEIYQYALTNALRDDSPSVADGASESNPISGNDFTTPKQFGIHFYNTMLDVYAECRKKSMFSFYEQMVFKNLPLNGTTFNVFAKGCIFMDDRMRLVEVAEVMRVEGIMQRELAEPIRKEITDAYRNHTIENYPYSKSYRYLLANENRLKEEILAPVIDQPAWGRMVDVRDIRFLEMLQPYLDKYTIKVDEVARLHVEDEEAKKRQEEHDFVENYQVRADEKPTPEPSSQWAMEWLNY